MLLSTVCSKETVETNDAIQTGSLLALCLCVWCGTSWRRCKCVNLFSQTIMSPRLWLDFYRFVAIHGLNRKWKAMSLRFSVSCVGSVCGSFVSHIFTIRSVCIGFQFRISLQKILWSIRVFLLYTYFCPSLLLFFPLFVFIDGTDVPERAENARRIAQLTNSAVPNAGGVSISFSSQLVAYFYLFYYSSIECCDCTLFSFFLNFFSLI